jgi:hypothetical protein
MDATEFQKGLKVEREHAQTLLDLIRDVRAGQVKPMEYYFGRISADHLKEIEDYYTRLLAMEEQAKYPAVATVLGELGPDEFVSQDVEIDFDGQSGKVSLRWGAEVDARSWGIKGIDLSVPTQKLSFVGETETGEDKDIEVEISDAETELEFGGSDFPSLGVVPILISVQSDGSATVTFAVI